MEALTSLMLLLAGGLTILLLALGFLLACVPVMIVFALTVKAILIASELHDASRGRVDVPDVAYDTVTDGEVGVVTEDIPRIRWEDVR